jgi:hypothetical protein
LLIIFTIGKLTGRDNGKFSWELWASDKADKHGVSLVGWPLSTTKPTALSNIHTVGEMTLLLEAVNDGTCYLEKTDDDENPRSADGKFFKPYKSTNTKVCQIDIIGSHISDRTRASKKRKFIDIYSSDDESAAVRVGHAELGTLINNEMYTRRPRAWTHRIILAQIHQLQSIAQTQALIQQARRY